MIKFTLPLFIIMVLAGCEPTLWKKGITVCPDDPALLAEFVLQCAKNANPLSDEEGEDLVRECRRTGITLYCTNTPGFTVKSSHTIPCDKAETVREKDICGIRR